MLGDFWEMMRSPPVLKFNTFFTAVKQQTFSNHLGPCGPCFHPPNSEWRMKCAKKIIHINFLPQKPWNQLSRFSPFSWSKFWSVQLSPQVCYPEGRRGRPSKPGLWMDGCIRKIGASVASTKSHAFGVVCSDLPPNKYTAYQIIIY